jgi:hypothetical protein
MHKRVEFSKPGHDNRVKPLPPAVLVDIVWLAPATAIKTRKPQTAPDISIVLI